MYPDNVGDAIRRYRRKRKLTQEALASVSGVTATTIARLETGRNVPRVSTLTAIAAALGVTVHELLG